MKCINIRQPWATLLVHGATQYLVRHWRTFHRGPLAIQAGITMSRSEVELCCDPDMRKLLGQFGYDYAMELPRQVLLGKVTVSDCLYIREDTLEFMDPEDPATIYGLIQPCTWVWICTAHQALRQPIPISGKLGIFKIPDSVMSGGS
jgi:hypothetical protein